MTDALTAFTTQLNQLPGTAPPLLDVPDIGIVGGGESDSEIPWKWVGMGVAVVVVIGLLWYLLKGYKDKDDEGTSGY